jgi:hypothetical protein
VQVIGLAMMLSGTMSSAAAAQSSRPAPIAEATLGWAGFIDERWIDHTTIGASARVFITPRIAIGPEIIYLRGPAGDRDWTLTGNATIDLRVERTPARPAATPYLVFGGGYLRQIQRFGSATFSSGEGTVSAGGGIRIALGSRAFIAPEMRIGWEPELRVGVTFGLRPAW